MYFDSSEFLEIFLAGYSGNVSNGKVWALFENVSKIFLRLRTNSSFLELVRKMVDELVITHPMLAQKLLSQWHNHSLIGEKE